MDLDFMQEFLLNCGDVFIATKKITGVNNNNNIYNNLRNINTNNNSPDISEPETFIALYALQHHDVVKLSRFDILNI